MNALLNGELHGNLAGEPKTTTARLLESYNTNSARPTALDPAVRSTLFRSFRRALAGWFPPDLDTPILDVACGEGSLLCLFRELGYTNLAGCDISPENVRICHQLGLGFVRQFDALRLAEMPGAGGYGAIFAIDILEHFPKERAAGFLEQVRELLRPGGYAVIQVPNMGNLLSCLHLYYCLSHEFGLTEKSALVLMRLAGFDPERVEMRGAWGATTLAGRLREAYLSLLHRVVWLAEGAGRPHIPTKNLLIRASVP